MSKVLLIGQREFLENIRTRSFWIGVFIFPLILALFFVVPNLLERTREVRRYAVVDRSGWLGEAVERRAMASDLARVLSLAGARYLSRDPELERLPEVLRRIAPAAAGLEPGELPEVSQWLVTGGPRPPGATALVEHRDELRAWWRDLSSEEAREIAPDLARGRYRRVDVRVEPDSAEALFNRMVARDELFAYFVIGPDPVSEGGRGSRYVSRNLTDQELREWFAGLATAELQARRMEREAIDPQTIARIREPLVLEARRVTAAGEAAGVDEHEELRQWAPVAFVYILWLAIFTVSQMLLTNTIEEKSNRTVEVLLSSISPIQLMTGKIVGIAATGLTTVGSWILAFVVAVRFLPGVAGESPGVDLTALVDQPLYLVSFVLYFLLGYLFYAALLVSVGAVCNTLREAQNLMGPIMIVMLIPLLAMVPIGKDPNGMLARILSYVPPFTPFVMMNRSAGPPSALEYVLTTLLLLVSVVAAFWAAAKVFRIGILLTGKPPKLREILRWVRAPVGY